MLKIYLFDEIYYYCYPIVMVITFYIYYMDSKLHVFDFCFFQNPKNQIKS